MSKNKNKTFLVQGSFVVKANNKADAEMAIRRARVADTSVLSSKTYVERISASRAAEFTS